MVMTLLSREEKKTRHYGTCHKPSRGVCVVGCGDDWVPVERQRKVNAPTPLQCGLVFI